MLDDVLARRFDNPGLAMENPAAGVDESGEKVIELVRRLVEVNGLDQ